MPEIRQQRARRVVKRTVIGDDIAREDIEDLKDLEGRERETECRWGPAEEIPGPSGGDRHGDRIVVVKARRGKGGGTAPSVSYYRRGVLTICSLGDDGGRVAEEKDTKDERDNAEECKTAWPCSCCCALGGFEGFVNRI